MFFAFEAANNFSKAKDYILVPSFGKFCKCWFFGFNGWNALFISSKCYCKNLGARNFSFWWVLKVAKFGGESWLSWCLVPSFGKFSKSWFFGFDGWNVLFLSPKRCCKNIGASNFSFLMVLILANIGAESWLNLLLAPSFEKFSKSLFFGFYGWNELFMTPKGCCKNFGCFLS